MDNDTTEVPSLSSLFPASTGELPILSYAKPRRSWKRPAKWAFSLIAIVAVPYFLWTWFGNSYWAGFRLYLKQSEAIQHTPPADWVAFTSVDTSSKLHPQEKRMGITSSENRWNAPKPWLELANSSDVIRAALLYVGEHRSASGNVRIVFVMVANGYTSVQNPRTRGQSHLWHKLFIRRRP